MSRSTWHWSPEDGKLVEGPGPRRTDGSGDGWRFSDRIYSGKPFKAPDGTVIDSRKKHRDYMKRAGVTTVDDFKGEWAAAQKRREDVFAGRHDKRERREAIARSIEMLQQGGRRGS
jgi:hypothetical protein